MPTSRPKVSVVVPAYNAQKTLQRCLDSLMELNFPVEDREILVVDNNSTDETKNIILQYPVTYLFEPNQGRAWARNKGVKQAHFELVAFIDADCIATQDWLKNLVEGIMPYPNVAVGGGKILPFKQGNIFEKFIERRWLLSQEIGIKGRFEHDLPRVVTANAIFRKSILEQLGYFDEDLVTCEDTEISWRIDFAGYEMRLISEAIVHHQHIGDFWYFCTHHFEYGVADRILYQKYRSFLLKDAQVYPHKKPIEIFKEDVLAQVSYDIRIIWTEVKYLPLPYAILYILQKVSHDLGWLLIACRQLVYGKESFKHSKIPLDKFFNHQFKFQQDSITWSLNRPVTWFLSQDFLKMIIYGDFRVYKFNKVASQVWLSLRQTNNVHETVNEIADFYDIRKDLVAQDVNDFIGYLEEINLLKRN